MTGDSVAVWAHTFKITISHYGPQAKPTTNARLLTLMRANACLLTLTRANERLLTLTRANARLGTIMNNK